jgi:hypothetical protein
MVAYHPTDDQAAWDAAYEKYLHILEMAKYSD